MKTPKEAASVEYCAAWLSLLLLFALGPMRQRELQTPPETRRRKPPSEKEEVEEESTIRTERLQPSMHTRAVPRWALQAAAASGAA